MLFFYATLPPYISGKIMLLMFKSTSLSKVEIGHILLKNGGGDKSLSLPTPFLPGGNRLIMLQSTSFQSERIRFIT